MTTIQKINNESVEQFVKRIQGIMETHNLNVVSAEFNGWILEVTPSMSAEHCINYFLQPHLQLA